MSRDKPTDQQSNAKPASGGPTVDEQVAGKTRDQKVDQKVNPKVDKDRVMDEPVDALRQPQDKPNAESTSGSTSSSTSNQGSGDRSQDKAKAGSDKKGSGAQSQAPAQTPSQNTSKATHQPQPVLTGGAGNPPPAAPASPAKAGGPARGGVPVLSIALVLAVVALAAGLWWQQQRFDTVAREVATRLQQSDQTVTQANQRAAEALSVANSQRDLVDQLSRELSVSNNELRTLQQAWEAANDGLDQTLLLNDLRRLITLANQELTLFGNVGSAIAILSSVQPMLKNQSAPALRNLHQAVLTDLSRLHAAPQVDVALLAARLDSLIQLTDKAPLLSPSGHITSLEPLAQKPVTKPTDSEPSSVDQSEGSWWQVTKDTVTRWGSDATSVLAREFADVMSIRKANDPQALLLSEEQAIQLRANVRAMLLSAQLALMTRQADIWRSELTQVQSLLNTRFDVEALDTKAALTVLKELLAAPVAVPVPQISDTMSALASADRAIAIPVDSGATSETDAQEPEASDAATDQAPASDGATMQGT